MDTNEKKPVSKSQLRDKWQSIMSAQELSGDAVPPGFRSALHAMFMCGASTVIGAISVADDSNIEEIAQSFCEELEDYGQKMKLAVMEKGRAN